MYDLETPINFAVFPGLQASAGRVARSAWVAERVTSQSPRVEGRAGRV